jgi:hypothetical protein
LDADNSEDEEGTFGGNILAALLMDRVVYTAGEFISAFFQRLHPNSFQILPMQWTWWLPCFSVAILMRMTVSSEIMSGPSMTHLGGRLLLMLPQRG